MKTDTPRERAEYFIEHLWPKVASLDDPWRGFKTFALALAHDVLELTEKDDSAK